MESEKQSRASIEKIQWTKWTDNQTWTGEGQHCVSKQQAIWIEAIKIIGRVEKKFRKSELEMEKWV